MKLSTEYFERARAFLIREGRPLEQALFRHFFEGAPVEEPLAALTAHQADNGGFFDMGEGPRDCSSPIGTTVAFQHLADLKVSADHPLAQNGSRYLIKAYNHDFEAWSPTEHDEAYFKTEVMRYWGNPGAEIVGYLWLYKEIVPSEFLDRVTGVAVNHLRGISGPIPEFSDLCFLRCAKFIDPQHRNEIVQRVASGAINNLQLDHTKWGQGYFIKPYWYAMAPDEPLFPLLKDEIAACLAFDIRTQTPDGSTMLTFHVPQEDELTWKSMWTLESLRALKAYEDLLVQPNIASNRS